MRVLLGRFAPQEWRAWNLLKNAREDSPLGMKFEWMSFFKIEKNDEIWAKNEDRSESYDCTVNEDQKFWAQRSKLFSILI